MNRREALRKMGQAVLAASVTPLVSAPIGAPEPDTMSVAMVGDCLITRGFLPQETNFPPLRELLRGADVTFGNFEMTLPDPGMPPAPTGSCGDLNNAAEGPIPADLHWAGFKIMSLANNHSLDFGIAGMRATARKIAQAGIAHAGTGENLADARAPAYHDSPHGRCALVACAATFRPWSLASDGNGEIPGRPGLDPLRHQTTYQVRPEQIQSLRSIAADLSFSQHSGLVPVKDPEAFWFLERRFVAGTPDDILTKPDSSDLQGIVASVRRASRNADIVLLSVHAHEFHRRPEIPAEFLREFAHAAVDSGADAVVGHGPHLLRGIEIYKGSPIFYSLGNFIFEAESMRQIPEEIYQTCGLSGDDPSSFFDLAMKAFSSDVYWESVVAVGRFRKRKLEELKLYPVTLQPALPRAERGMPVLAGAELGGRIIERLAALSKSFGTRISYRDGVGVVTV
jgi:hypothetical protein